MSTVGDVQEGGSDRVEPVVEALHDVASGCVRVSGSAVKVQRLLEVMAVYVF